MEIINPNEIPSHILHRILLTAVAPRPIALASTIDAFGKPNLSPFSCFNVFGVNPSTLVFSPSRSGRTNKLKDTCLNVNEVPEVVINVVNYAMLEQMNLSSSEYPKGVDEFIKSGFTPIESHLVKPFRVKESPIQMECKVRQVIETGNGPGAANLIICEVLLIHVQQNVLDKNGMPDTRKLDLIGRLGADYYVHANGKALFTLPKPSEQLAKGVDALPEAIRMSSVLTGNDLGKLGSLSHFPTSIELEKFKVSEEFKKMVINVGRSNQLEKEVHQLAHNLLINNEVHLALLWLLAIE